MKKILALILAACMVFALCACGAEKAPAEAPAEQEEGPAEVVEEAPEAEAAEAAEYTLGMGIDVDMSSSDTGNAQVDATFAAVVLDGEGKIVSCRLDAVQNKMDVTDGAVDTEATFLTKMEKGDDYNMVAYSNATIEWYDQAKNFETYVTGKTAEEVKNIETVVNEEGHNVAVDETLYAGCSISIEAFINAVVKACEDQGAQTFTAESFTLGVAAISTSDESTEATADEDAVVKMYSEFAATVVDAEGKVIAAVTDAIQPKITVDADGEIVETAFKGTKRELGPDYGMVAYGNAIAEWDAQAQAFADYCVGQTADEIRSLETVVNEEGHQVTVDETLFAACTMSIGGMMAVIAQAVDYAR